MRTEKKCPHCEVWTMWEKLPTDRCVSCNGLLDEHALNEKIKREETERVYKENDFLRIRDTDGIGMRSVRTVARVFHIIFATIAWMFLWFVTTFAG